MKKLLFTLLVSLFCSQIQAQMRCKVLEAGTQQPIIGATVMALNTKKIVAVTDQNGCFLLSTNFNQQVKISYIGYKPLQVVPKQGAVYHLNLDVNSLQEVVVTAQEGRGLSSVSTISKQAMEHLQPSSFTDLLELLPGGRAHDPHLNVPNTINLREVPIASNQYNTSSLGTRFIIDVHQLA